MLTVIAALTVIFTGCNKKDGAVTTTQLSGDRAGMTTPERTTEGLKDKLDDAMETVSEKLSEAGSTIREGITDLSEAMTGNDTSRP